MRSVKEETFDEVREAKKAALRILERMDRSVKELTEKLSLKGFSEEAVKEAVSYVTSFGYLNDKRFADQYIFAHRDRKSRTRIMFELKSKGVSEEIITAAFEELAPYDEMPLIRRLAEKRLGDPCKAGFEDVRRCKVYFLRNGFRMHDVEEVFREFESGSCE